VAETIANHEGRRFAGDLGPATPVVALLALAIFINALDRGNYSTAAPLIKDALKLSNAQIGVLISAFFWSYVPGHALAGWLIERIDAYRTLALGLALWSLATLLTGLAGSFAVLLALRLVLGIGESTAWPATAKLLALHIPARRLASANAWTGAGLALGNGAGIFIGGLLVASLGWHALFFVFGGLSLLWLVPWLTVRRPEPIAHPFGGDAGAGSGDAPSYGELLRSREMWGAMIGHFCGNYSYFLVLSWLPLFLVKNQGFSITAMAWLGGTVYVLVAIFGFMGSGIADRLIARGADANRVRKTFAILSGLVALACMLACATGSPRLAVAGLLGYSLANGLGTFSVFSIGQTLAGPRAAGKWMGLQNGVGGLAGVVSPIVTGISIDMTGDYRVAFLVAAVTPIVAMLCWGVIVRRIEPIVWSVNASRAAGGLGKGGPVKWPTDAGRSFPP
jgi:MFS family permease